jgi:hypothetical protein
MKKLTVLRALLALLIITGVSCKGNSNTEARLKKLEEENKELREKLEQTNNTEESPYSNTSNSNNYANTPDPYYSQASKYVFVLLSVSQKEYAENYMGKVTKTYNYCSGIEQFPYVTEDLKYQLMDKVQSKYQNSGGAMLYDGEVNDRKVFVFDSYEQASKEREKYLINK